MKKFILSAAFLLCAITLVGGSRDTMTGPRTYYVDPINGVDDFAVRDGLSEAAAWRTLQYAGDFVVSYLDTANFNVTVQGVCQSQYAPCTFLKVQLKSAVIGNGWLQFRGDPNNPGNFIINEDYVPASFNATFGAKYMVGGWKCQGVLSDNCLYISGGGSLIRVVEKMEFGQRAATGQAGANTSHIKTNVGGLATIETGIIVSGGAAVGFWSDPDGMIEFATSGLIEFQNTPHFPGATIFANGGKVLAYDVNWSGAATGNQAVAAINGVLYTKGAAANIPGTANTLIETSGGRIN